MLSQFCEKDYWNNSYHQRVFGTFVGETCLVIIPKVCPTGKYSCAKRVFSGDENSITLTECPNLVHYSDNALYCQKMKHGVSEMYDESFEDLF